MANGRNLWHAFGSVIQHLGTHTNARQRRYHVVGEYSQEGIFLAIDLGQFFGALGQLGRSFIDNGLEILHVFAHVADVEPKGISREQDREKEDQDTLPIVGGHGKGENRPA